MLVGHTTLLEIPCHGSNNISRTPDQDFRCFTYSFEIILSHIHIHVPGKIKYEQPNVSRTLAILPCNVKMTSPYDMYVASQCAHVYEKSRLSFIQKLLMRTNGKCNSSHAPIRFYQLHKETTRQLLRSQSNLEKWIPQ